MQLSVRIPPSTSLRLIDTTIRVPMHEQLHASIENATTLPNRYPSQPTRALMASIDARRAFLLGTYVPPREPHSSETGLRIERISAFEPEVHLS